MYNQQPDPKQSGNINERRASVESGGSLTLAGADEEVAIGRDGAVEEVHHRARVSVANQRHRHLLLVHPSASASAKPNLASTPHLHRAKPKTARRPRPSPIK